MEMFCLIPVFPGARAFVLAVFGKWPSKKTVSWQACLSVFASFLLSLVSFFGLLKISPESLPVVKILFRWIESGSFNADLSLQLDPLSSVMTLVVTGVGFLIHIYSVGYMAHDKGYKRYFTYLNLFTFAMLILVMGANLVLMFVGWEGVGLCSYLLIGFWFEKHSAANAGKKAFIVNRIGDAAFILGIFFIFLIVGSGDFRAITGAIEGGAVTQGMATLIALLLFIGATGKSAQIPLYVWLPDAMEGPTPVRALAYSPLSQIGYMFIGCGVGAYAAGMFHLFTHAFFKSLLFLAAGSVMHALSGELDMRKMGGLRKYLPLTYPTFLIGAIAIAGVPFLSGFFSKDAILTQAFAQGQYFIWAFGLLGAVLTAFYMFRLVFLTFFGQERIETPPKEHLHESPRVMTVPLVMLAFFSIVAGYVGLPVVFGEKANLFNRFLEPVIHPGHEGAHLSISAEGLLHLASGAGALF